MSINRKSKKESYAKISFLKDGMIFTHSFKHKNNSINVIELLEWISLHTNYDIKMIEKFEIEIDEK